MLRALDFELVEVERGFAAFHGEPDERFLNPTGMVHGGYAATLLDSACGIAAQKLASAGQAFTTLELKVSYHRAISSRTGLVRAEGRVVSPGRRAVFAEAALKDAAGRLLASATSTLLAIDTPAHVPADAPFDKES